MASLSSKGSSKLKKKHLRLKHQKAKVFRANEPLLSVFMWGVNHTINELAHVNIPVMLMPDDFKAFSKIKVDNHHFNKENLPSHFKVKEYCPMVFKNLRERFGIDETDYVNSLTKSQPVSFHSSGRSGARFFLSYDKLFIMKTLLSEEVEQLHILMKQYHPYVVERHGKTLLPQYLAMYRLTVDGAETYFVVMRNIFSSSLTVHKKYDLKGSTVDREASDKEREKDLPTLKDNDFVRDGYKVFLGTEDKERLMDMLNADVAFLAKMNLMDYSLCLGVHDSVRAEQEALEREREAMEAMEGSGGEGGGCGGGGGPIGGPTDEDEDSAGSGGGLGAGPTPPDSPAALGAGGPRDSLTNGVFSATRDIYAIQSKADAPSREVYFMALVDVLTHYGVKKRTAQAAKTVKHGTAAEISTVHPEQYAKRLLDFIVKAFQ